MNFIKQGKTNWNYIGIVILLGILVVGTILWYVIKQEISLTEFPEIKKPEEGINAQQVILSDEGVNEILREYAQKRTISFNDVGADRILLDALEFKDTDIKNRVQELIRKFEDLELEIQDAPDLRSWKVQRTKVCIAESIIFNDLENTTQRCGYEPEFFFSGADDLLADTQVISFFINGFAHYYKEDHLRADYYFNQIKLHRSLLEGFEVDFSVKYLELYNKIYNKVLEISSEIFEGEEAKFQGGAQTIGEPTDGLMLNAIRYSDHGAFYRFVFEIKKLDGSEAQAIPFTKAVLYASAKVIEVVINGMRNNLAGPSIGKIVEIGDPVVFSYVQEKIYDDQTLQYSIALNKYSEYYLYALTNPVRIIIDIQK
ncbi:hypothetical protein KJA15_00385 [Patescibacteria group bacterium]|nr:hypothetical protein [Patescibacteria group bacterium]